MLSRKNNKMRRRMLIVLFGVVLSAGLVSQKCMVRTMWSTGGDESPTYISVGGNVIDPSSGGLVNGLDPNDKTIRTSCATAQNIPQLGPSCVSYLKKWTRSDDATKYIEFNQNGTMTSNVFTTATLWHYNEDGKGAIKTYDHDANNTFVQTFIIKNGELYLSDNAGLTYGSTYYR